MSVRARGLLDGSIVVSDGVNIAIAVAVGLLLVAMGVTIRRISRARA